MAVRAPEQVWNDLAARASGLGRQPAVLGPYLHTDLTSEDTGQKMFAYPNRSRHAGRNIIAWLKAEGDQVTRRTLYQVETPKP
jgi:hypothetical protein